jgi:hypothetical protein
MGRDGSSPDAPRRYWPAFLRGDDANEVYSRLLGDGDPLRLQERVAKRMREVWFLVEHERLVIRTAVLCAKGAVSEAAPEDLEAWSIRKIDAAIDQLLRRDEEAERREPALVEEEEKVFPLLTYALLRDPQRVREYTVRFNALEPLVRRAFFELMIEGREVMEVIEAGPWNRETLRGYVLQALAALDLPLPPETPKKESPQP